MVEFSLNYEMAERLRDALRKSAIFVFTRTKGLNNNEWLAQLVVQEEEMDQVGQKKDCYRLELLEENVPFANDLPCIVEAIASCAFQAGFGLVHLVGYPQKRKEKSSKLVFSAVRDGESISFKFDCSRRIKSETKLFDRLLVFQLPVSHRNLNDNLSGLAALMASRRGTALASKLEQLVTKAFWLGVQSRAEDALR